MLLDRLKSLLKINYVDSYIGDIDTSLSLTINLMEMLGINYDEVVEIITSFLTDNYGKNIKEIDKVVRYAIMTALNMMVSCANSPIIDDDLLYDIDSENNFNGARNPITINLQSMDLYNLFTRANPTDDHGDYYYGDIPTNLDIKIPSNMWKSGDLDAFIWYVINMVEPLSAGDVGARSQNNKVTWDNRNTKFKKDLENEGFVEGSDEYYTGEEADAFWGGIESGTESTERKKLFHLAYDSSKNAIEISLDPTTYGEKKIYTIAKLKNKEGEEFEYKRNHTIYDFNKDYMENMRIFYVKPVVASILNTLLNNSISLSIGGTLSFEEEVIKGEISKVISNMIEADDTEIEDCYFNFSNDEYNEIIREAELKKWGVRVSKGDVNAGEVMSPENAIEILDNFSSTSTLQEQKTIIKNTFDVVVAATGATDDNIRNTINWNADSFKNKILSLIRDIAMKLMEAVLTPRVILIFLINYKFANGKLPKNALDFLSAFVKLIWPAIKSVLDFITDMLLDWVEERIKKYFQQLCLEMVMEKLKQIKEIMLALIESCTLNINLPNNTRLIGNIDNVVGADIIATDEVKKTPNNEFC